MGGEFIEEADMEVLPSMWPDDIGNETRKQFNMDRPGVNRDMLEDVMIKDDPSVVDFKRLLELTSYSEKGSSQLAYLVKHWEYKHNNAVRLLNEELNILSKQRQEVELKKLEILEEHRFEEDRYAGSKRSVSILEDACDIWGRVPRRRNGILGYNRKLDIDAGYDTVTYWKQRAIGLDKMLEESIEREHVLTQKLEENIKNLETQPSPVEELSQILKRADNFLHFILQTAPVVIGHQDKELRYRFIYNHFPRLEEEDIIGKTDEEIFSGAGVKEIQDFKREVLERGSPAKREITFDTPLFGSKTFMIYVEPVFSKTGDRIGVNYMGMDVTDQVAKREKMAKLREEIAVQKAKETELNKTIHITEETMRAKQMLATMSHEIRSPLTGVVSMAEILATTKLDKEQSQLLDVMISSGDLVLQLINDILDLAKFESGAMKLEATRFRPREVVGHVLQTAAASLKKELTLEGHVDDDVPVEVIGDVLRIRQILTNLISNAIKFTHEGKVGINLHVVSEQYPGCQEQHHQDLTAVLPSTRLPKKNSSETQSYIDRETSHCSTCQEGPDQNTSEKHHLTNEDPEKYNQNYEKIVWLRCDVYDTGIGIPEKALPSLFKKYMQASADHARKYGGTGLGLAICKQLVELMGGNLTVTSKEHCGSTFTFVLPYKIPLKRECPDDHDEDAATSVDSSTDEINGSFIFKPRTRGTLFSSDESTVRKTKPSGSSMLGTLDSSNGLSESDSFSSSDGTSRTSVDGASQISDATKTVAEPKGLLQQSLGHNVNDFGRINRRDEGCQDSSNGFVMHKFDGSIMDSSRTQRTSGLQQSQMAFSEGANMAASGKCVPTCQSLRHEKEDDKSKCTSDTSSFKILLVEDNKINVMVAQSMMKQLGHKIDVVNNGLEAIRAVQHSHYDLILMDVCMPVMDGMQATRLIRSFEEHGCWDASVANGDDHAITCPDSPSHGPEAGRCRKRIPIVAMTANALAESAADCLANGMDSFVSKPVTFQNLKQCLQQYLPC
ncbi:probable histidine kinase 1 [Elaeis guineensis]|uniref:histidine kinase n=1 Tax=Elaeis guineensis var. tenera TaxID=51953 RepID=A0A6I9RLD4_ELAGV|nr:probable histidine kinase 1 [Elaeis guineensis]XP_029122001.1 probable histidine kinase 1 [Elaeis guineensis]